MINPEKQYIQNLKKLDRADLARIKRCAGRSEEYWGGSLALMLRLLPESTHGKSYLEQDYFLIATLYALARESGSGNLGQALRRAVQKDPDSEQSLDRRLITLLDCSREALPFRLRQIVQYLTSKEIFFDWEELLKDVRRWDLSSRPTQKKWTRSYFGVAEVMPIEATDDLITDDITTLEEE